MSNVMKKRAIIGTTCLVAVALTMGWFVGQYIPGQPKAPEPDPYQYMVPGNGSATEIYDYAPGESAEFTGMTAGYRFISSDAFGGIQNEEERIEALKKEGLWEFDYPSVKIAVQEAKAVSADSFNEWYPHVLRFNKTFNDTSVVLVTIAVSNTSDTTIAGSYSPFGGVLPELSLWNSTLLNANNNVGNGIYISEGLYVLNEGVPIENPEPNGPTAELVHIEPGQTQQLILPYVISKNSFTDRGTYDDLKLEDFCIQAADYDSATLYRLWLPEDQ